MKKYPLPSTFGLVLLLGTSLVASVGLTACGGGGGGGGGDTSTPPGQTLSGGTITGTVSDQSGAGLANVQVVAGSGVGAQTVTTNEQGFFALVSVTAGDPVLSFELPGYASNMKAVAVEDGRNSQVVVSLQQVGTEQQIDATQSATVTHRGGSVVLPAGGIVDMNGQPVSDAVVSVTTLIPGDPEFVQAFPGEFIGTDSGGTGPLISFGVVDVTLRDSSGGELQLAAGETATVEFPIPPPAFDTGDPTVPLWYLDPATAVWIQEGTATRDAAAGVFRGTVAHFTPWNCDLRPPSAFKRIHLTFNGLPVVNATLQIDGSNWAAGGSTDANGEVLLGVPALATGSVRMLDAAGRWIMLNASETMAAAGQTFDNFYTEADGVVPQIATVILTWGAMPTDLDSHMTIPTEGSRSHVYYSSLGSLVNTPYCALNTDDTTSFGPEIITVTRAFTGTYRYCVHNYSTNAQHPISQSGATVILITRDRGGRIYTVPPDNAPNENYWGVFDLVFDASGALTIRDINRFGDSSILNL